MSGDVWTALRARQWWHFLGLPLVALDVGGLAGAEVWRVPVAALVAGCCLAVAYAINAVCERFTDRAPGKNPLVVRPELAGAVLRRCGVVAMVGVSGALWLGGWAPWAVLVSLVAGVVYSASAWGKRAPVLGLLGNTLIFAPLMLLLHPGGELGAEGGVEAGLFVVLLAQNQLLHERADVEEDAAAGAWTTGRWLGARGTERVVGGLGVIGVFVAMMAEGVGAQVAGGVGVIGATCVGLWMRPVAARRWHRWWALVGGGLVFLLQRVFN